MSEPVHLTLYGPYLAVHMRRVDSNGLSEVVQAVHLDDGRQIYVREYPRDGKHPVYVVAEVPTRGNPVVFPQSPDEVAAAIDRLRLSGG